jgi:hypothetical protein
MGSSRAESDAGSGGMRSRIERFDRRQQQRRWLALPMAC